MEKSETHVHPQQLPDGNSPRDSFVEPVAEPEQHVHFKTIILLIAIVTGYAVQVFNIVGAGFLGQSIVAAVGGGDQVTWLVSSVTIMAACLGLPISQSADHWGRKWFVVILSGLSTVGCIVVATAESMAVAIAGQCIVGFSYAVQALEHSIASEILPRKYRPYAQASISAATSLGGVAGLLIGGALTRNNPSGFRTYWYITAGLYAATTLTIAWLYNPPLRELQHKLTTFEKLARLDWIGYCFVICGLVLFSFALTSSTGIYPWRSAEILVPLVLGSAFLLAFGIYEWRFTSTGMLHHDLFSRSRNFALAELCIFLEGICFFASNNYFGYEVSVLYDQDQFHAGLWYTVAWWSCLVSAWVAGLYCSKTKTVRLTVVLAMAAWTLFNALMATLTPSTRSHILGYAPFMGIGFGAALNILVVVAQLSTPPELISITTGLLLATRGFGGTVGLSIYTAIFTGTLSHELPGKVGRATVAQGLDPSYVDQLVAYVATSDWASVGNMPNMTESISQAALLASKESYALAFRYVWICAAVFCAFGILAAAFLIDPKGEFNGHIDAPVETEEELSRGRIQIIRHGQV